MRLSRTNRSHQVGLQHNHALDIQPGVQIPRHPALHGVMPLAGVILLSGSSMAWGFGCPVSVALNGNRLWPEHIDAMSAESPNQGESADGLSPVQSEVTLAYPSDDLPPGVVVDIAKGLLADTVTEIVTPALQHRIESAQQVGELSTQFATGESPNSVHHREQALLRWIGIDPDPGHQIATKKVETPTTRVKAPISRPRPL